MNKLITCFLSAAVVASLCAGAQATTATSKSEYKATKEQAAATFRAAKAKCESLAGNAKDLCQVEAKAQRMRAEADAEAAYKNTREAWYEQRVAYADADYLVAKERCDDLGGNPKDVCREEAKAAHTKAKVDAKAARNTGQAQGEAREEANEARKNAAQDKRDADYKVELERCDTLAGRKDQCVQHARKYSANRRIGLTARRHENARRSGSSCALTAGIALTGHCSG
jgi:hypothetical protein